MKNKIIHLTISFFAVFFAIRTSGQGELNAFIELNSLDTLGVKQGIWKEIDSIMGGWSIAFYKDGKLCGNYISFNEDGDVISYSTFVDGKKHGISRTTFEGVVRLTEYENGTVISSRNYIGKLLTLEEIYINGDLIKSIHYTEQGPIIGTRLDGK
jgi:antitoxin component YwqK of YwqJK toxin-antitoxin module